MSLFKKPRTIMMVFCTAVLLTVMLILFNFEPQQESSDPPPRRQEQESFVFFDLGAETTFTGETRKQLKNLLGPDRLEDWSPIDLEMHEQGILQKISPRLHETNRQFSDDSVEVGENTIKITYRYARNKKLPFYYIKLVFSKYTRKPLYFRIKSKMDGAYIIDTIRNKYGEPEKVKWDTDFAYTLIWQKNHDILTISKVEDRIGYPELQMMIYYGENIETFAKTRENIIRKRQKKEREAGRTAF